MTGSYLVRSAKVALIPNLALIQYSTALRRGLIMIATAIAVATATGDRELGFYAATGALYAGLMDRGDTPERDVGKATLMLAAFAFPMTLTTAVLSPWTVLSVLMVGVFAGAGGLASAVSMDASRAIMYSTVLSVIQIFEHQTVSAALAQAIAVSIGILAQALVAFGLGPFMTDRAERRPVIRALRAAAAALEQAADPSVTEFAGRGKVAAALGRAESVVKANRLPLDRERAYTRMLWATETLRAEALSIIERRKDGIPVDRHCDVMLAAAHVLRTAAHALHAGRGIGRRWLPRVTASVEKAAARDAADGSPVARELTAAAREVADEAIWAMTAPLGRRLPKPPRRQPVSAALRAGLEPGANPRRHMIRLFTAAVIACALSWVFQFDETAWMAMTVVVVLRPDIPSVSKRTIMRAIGTAVGVAIVVCVIYLLGHHPFWIGVFATFLAFLAFAVMNVNYAFFVGSIVCVTITLKAAAGGGSAVELGQARVFDVLIGCVLAVLISLAIPIWTGARMPELLAALAGSIAVWFDVLSRCLATGEADGPALAKASTGVRTAHLASLAGLDTTYIEPRIGTLDHRQASHIDAALIASMHQSQPAVALLLEGAGVVPSAAAEAASAADYMRRAALDVASLDDDAVRNRDHYGWVPAPDERVTGWGHDTAAELTLILSRANARAVAAERLIAGRPH